MTEQLRHKGVLSVVCNKCQMSMKGIVTRDHDDPISELEVRVDPCPFCIDEEKREAFRNAVSMML
jgi:hypothetical protein